MQRRRHALRLEDISLLNGSEILYASYGGYILTAILNRGVFLRGSFISLRNVCLARPDRRLREINAPATYQPNGSPAPSNQS